MYFGSLPNLMYDPVGDGNSMLVTNILKRAAFRVNMKKELVLLQKYDVADGETPEIVADKHHGSSFYHWVILIVNGISDVYHGWPKSTRQMQTYLTDKYTEAQLSEIHHYQIPQTSGDTTVMIEVENTTYPSATAISNLTYEMELNETKRKIDLLRNEYLGFFVSEFEAIMG